MQDPRTGRCLEAPHNHEALAAADVVVAVARRRIGQRQSWCFVDVCFLVVRFAVCVHKLVVGYFMGLLLGRKPEEDNRRELYWLVLCTPIFSLRTRIARSLLKPPF